LDQDGKTEALAVEIQQTEEESGLQETSAQANISQMLQLPLIIIYSNVTVLQDHTIMTMTTDTEHIKK